MEGFWGAKGVAIGPLELAWPMFMGTNYEQITPRTDHLGRIDPMDIYIYQTDHIDDILIYNLHSPSVISRYDIFCGICMF